MFIIHGYSIKNNGDSNISLIEDLMRELIEGYKMDNHFKHLADEMLIALQEYEKELDRYINEGEQSDDLKIPVKSKETADLILKFFNHGVKLYHFAQEQLKIKGK